MARYFERDENALRRIVALLLALADLADRACSMSLPVRAVVFSILRHAETIAWSLVLQITSTATARGRSRQPAQPMPSANLVGPPGPADLARLSFSLRALALILSQWGVGIASWGTGRAAVRATPSRSNIGKMRDLPGPAAHPAPDTS